MAGNASLALGRLLPVGRQGWLIRTPGFTAQEVRQLLSVARDDQRSRAVARCAARVDAWLPDEPHFIHCPLHAWQHLPRIVFWHTRGDSAEAIVRRIGVLGPAWGTDRALDVACARIADCLNRDPAAFGLPRYGRAGGYAQRWGGR